MSRGGRRFRVAQMRIRIPYERQGLIWFTAQTFDDQPAAVQERILDACEAVGGELAGALLAYVTTNRPIAAIMREYHFSSETTIYRMLRPWFEQMDRALFGGRQ